MLGVPVLITKKVNIWQEVKLSKSGYVVTDDIDDINRGLHYFCSLTPDRLQLLGRNARKYFQKQFDERPFNVLFSFTGTLSCKYNAVSIRRPISNPS